MAALSWAQIVRTGVALVGAIAALAGLIAIGAGEPAAGLWALVVGGVLLLAALLEARRYRPAAQDRDRSSGFEPTDEVFLDPTSSERLRVWVDPRSGERRYEADEPDH